MPKCVVGVDLGGTNVRARAFGPDGRPTGQLQSKPSRAQEGVEPVIEALAATIQDAIQSSTDQPEAIGIAVAGHIDDNAGVVRWAPNFGQKVGKVFKYWENVPLREKLSKSTGLRIHMGNDANLAALGEYLFGSGKGNANCLVLFTIGTGIGGGVVMGPRAVLGDSKGPLVLVGGNMGGGELGHTVILHGGLDSSAGAYGSIEGYCQRDAIVKRAAYRLNRGGKSILWEMCGAEPANVTPKMLSEAAAKGDELAIEVWQEIGAYLGVGIGNMINVFAPDVVAIGGQIAKAGELLLDSARKSARNVAIPSLFADARIVQAEHIDDAGLLGGAAFALEAGRWV